MPRPTRKQQVVGIVKALAEEITDFRTSAARRIVRPAAEALRQRITREYQTKSTGGTDTAGQHWKLTKRFRHDGPPMMIDTGDLLRSLKIGVRNDGKVIVSFNVDYAKHALAKRPAWPEGGIPDHWFEEFCREMAKGIADEIKRRLT